jgi:ectoine hydroxylase-related dioxygenase (phytanoyl-CoA dioxygenase family)
MKEFDYKTFENEMDLTGFFLYKNLISKHLCNNLKNTCSSAIQFESEKSTETGYDMHGRIFNCIENGGVFYELLEHLEFNEPFKRLLGNYYEVHVYTSSSVPPNGKSMFGRIHRESSRAFPGYYEGVGSLIFLDDFTLENGATWMLPESKYMNEKPTEEYFYSNAQRITGNCGDVLFFDPCTWHCAGTNTTSQWRHSISLGMVRSHLKTYMNNAALLDYKIDASWSDSLKQRLGFNSYASYSIESYYSGYGRK